MALHHRNSPGCQAASWQPLVVEMTPLLEPPEVFRRFSRLPHCVLLDSAAPHPRRGRYAYLAADPFSYLQAVPHGGQWQVRITRPANANDRHHSGSCVHLTQQPLKVLEGQLAQFNSVQIEELPTFQGGAAGLLSYDLGRSLEALPPPRFDEFQLPALAMGLYDVVLAYDLVQQRAWWISQGWPEVDPAARARRAHDRLTQFQRHIAQTDRLDRWPATRPQPVQLAGPQYQLPVQRGLISNFTAEQFLATVRRAIDYIRAGDVYQVNLAQRLMQPAACPSTQLYEVLRRRNPAPFAAYCDLGSAQIISASPERFLRVQGRDVETRPIKGTRRRTSQTEADLFLQSDLRQSEKDRAENVMIVDLMRNDLSRVCRADSVRVTQLCEVESYRYVQHLVSAVTGTLRDECSSVDLVAASFPGGSITGAPKIRAMEIIAELEPHARGAYCGSLGYFNWDGSLDLSILIRTITASGGWWQLPVGGGIVAQSDPELELQETWHKAQGLVTAEID